jgi:hypothetical protein
MTLESIDLIEGNFFYNTSSSSCYNPITISSSWNNSFGRSGLTIRNNIIALGGSVISGNSGNIAAIRAFGGAPIPWGSLKIYNNSIYCALDGIVGINIESGSISSSGTLDVRNNIVRDCSGGTDYSIPGGVSSTTHDYNLIWRSSGSASISTAGSSCSGSNITTCEAHSLSTDPKFTLTATPFIDTNFKLQSGSPAVGIGTAITGFSTDYFGTTRVVPWAIGAAQPGGAATDTTPPSVPISLGATVVSSSQINLSWTASTDPDSAVAGYNIFRNGVKIGTSTGASYSDTGLTASTSYTYTVSAFDPSGNTSAASSSVSATTSAVPPPVPASITATAGTVQTAAVNTNFGIAMAATVKDANNNPVSGVAVTFTAPSGGASGTFSGLTTETVITDANGVATDPPFKANSTTGTYTVTATVSGVPNPANFSLTNTAAAPASITSTGGTPQSAAINASFTTALTATVKDASNNLLSSVTVTFTAPASGPGGTFTGGSNTATVTTNSSGVATSPAFTANGTSGSYTVSATVAGVPTPANFSLTNTAGAPASITSTGGTPQSATVSASFSTALSATVKDAGNNLLSGISVTFSAPASGASGTFTGGGTTTTVTTNASGVATAPTFTANANTGSYTVTATVSGVGTPAAFGLTNKAATTPAVTPTNQIPFNFPNLGVTSMISGGTSGVLAVGDASIQVNPGSATPTGVAIFGLREMGVLGFSDTGVLVTEAGVPATPLIQTGRVYVQVTGVRNTGIAMANPGVQDAVVSFSFTNTNGNTFGAGSITIPAGQQIAKFLDEAPFNSSNSVEGTFTFSSSVPVTVIALRTFVNERGDFLVTTLPVADLSSPSGSSTVVLPHFADGGGWVTSVILVNPTASPIVGTIQFLSPSGSPLTLTAGGKRNSTFNYAVEGNSSFRLVTAGNGSTTNSGSVRVVPSSNTAAPVGLAVYSYLQTGITVTEAGVPSISGTAFRAYVETSSTPGAVIQSGLAIANVSTVPATITLQLFNPDGTTAAASTSLTVPGSGQIAKFLSDLFPNLPQPFLGVVRISGGSSSLAVVGLRTRYNERGDFLITTTPAASESAVTPGQLFFPHLAIGGGYSTQLILFTGSPGPSSSGTLNFLSQSGGPWAITPQ